MPNKPNEHLQGYLNKAGVHATGSNWNQVDPNVSGHSGAVDVDALNRLASSRAVQQTTTERRRTTEERMVSHNDLLARASSGEYGQAAKDIADRNMARDRAKESTPDPAIPTPDPLTGHQSDIDRIRSQAESDIGKINSELDRIQGSMDAASQMLIQSIKQKYAGAIAEMRDSNTRLLATKGVMGHRTGRTRYTPGVQAGLISDEEVQGSYRIAKLEGEMLKLVVEAEQARTGNEIKVFNMKYDRIEQVKKDMQNEIVGVFDAIEKREEAQRAEEKAQRDTEKVEWERALEQSERAAPALANALASLTTDEERAELISTYATQNNIDPGVLWGDVQLSLDKATKSAMDIRNIENTIMNRDQANARGWESNARGWATENRQQTKQQLDIDEKETKAGIRQLIVERLSNGKISREEAIKDGKISREEAMEVWVSAGFSIEEFNKEFPEKEDDLL